MLKTSEKYGAETESHLSILYGLYPNTTAQQCREKLSPWFGNLVEVELDENGTSIFENEDRPYDVVKIDVKMSKELKAMNSALMELPFENDFPDFKAHITLAYVKKGLGKNYVGLKVPKTATISKIVLSNPDGKRSTLWKNELQKEAQKQQSTAQFSEDQLQDIAKSYAGSQGPDLRAEDLAWRYEANYPLEKVCGAGENSRGDWLSWYAEEKEAWQAEGTYPNRFEELEKYWKTDPDDPIVIVEIDGKGHLWDGAHRVGISHLFQRPTIPAIVGTVKTKTSAQTWYDLAKQADSDVHEVFDLLKDTYFSEGYRGFGGDPKEYVEANNWSLEEIDLKDLVMPGRIEWLVNEWLPEEGPSMTEGPIVVGPNPTDEDRIPWKGYEILDGWHRVAEAVGRGDKTITGWVGRPKANVQAKAKMHLTKTAQFGAQFTRSPGAQSQTYGNDFWNHQQGLTEILLEHIRNPDPQFNELLEKRMNQDRRQGKVERQQIVDTQQVAETLLDASHDPDAAYKSTEQLMESHRTKPLVLAQNLQMVKTAFDYTTDSAEDIESRWGWMNNVDDPMACRVQGPNRFDEGLNWTWREGKSSNETLDTSDQPDASDYRNVARQSRYNPEYVNGIYYEWIEPRDGPDEDNPGKSPNLGFGTSTDGELSFNSETAAQFQRFAKALAPIEGLHAFIEAVKQQVGSGKIQGTRLLISPQLGDAVAVAAGDDLKVYAPLPVSSSLEIRFSSPHIGYATEIFKDTTPQAAINMIKARIGKDVTINWVRTCACPVWLVDPKVEDVAIQAAEEFAAGEATPENRQAFETITRLGSLKQEAVGTICKLIQEIGADLGLGVEAPEMPQDKTAEDWIGINNLTIRCGSLDEALKLSGLLVDKLGGRNSVLLPDGEVTWSYRGLRCRFLSGKETAV